MRKHAGFGLFLTIFAARSFQNGLFRRKSALAVVLFLTISSATAVLLFFFKRKEYEL
jgi:hypothetical protein